MAFQFLSSIFDYLLTHYCKVDLVGLYFNCQVLNSRKILSCKAVWKSSSSKDFYFFGYVVAIYFSIIMKSTEQYWHFLEIHLKQLKWLKKNVRTFNKNPFLCIFLDLYKGIENSFLYSYLDTNKARVNSFLYSFRFGLSFSNFFLLVLKLETLTEFWKL